MIVLIVLMIGACWISFTIMVTAIVNFFEARKSSRRSWKFQLELNYTLDILLQTQLLENLLLRSSLEIDKDRRLHILEAAKSYERSIEKKKIQLREWMKDSYL